MAINKKPENHPENFNAWMEEICNQLIAIKGSEWFDENIPSIKSLANNAKNIPTEIINVAENTLMSKKASSDSAGIDCVNLGVNTISLSKNASVFGTSNVCGGMCIAYDEASTEIVDLDADNKFTQLKFKKSSIKRRLAEISSIAKVGTPIIIFGTPVPIYERRRNTFASYDTSTGILTFGNKESLSFLDRGFLFCVNTDAEGMEVFGIDNINASKSSHAEGNNNAVVGVASHVEGDTNLCIGTCSHVEGGNNEITGSYSHVEGQKCKASGSYAHAQNYLTSADGVQTAIGSYNITPAKTGLQHNPTDWLFIVGNGVDTGSNAFTVDWSGNCNAGGSYNTVGKDYSEIFEWQDGNPNAEDRVGYFVTTVGTKIKVLETADDYVVGIVSSTPSIIGDSYADRWRNKYVLDKWERIVYEDIEIDDPEYDGDETPTKKIVSVPKLNKEFNRALNNSYESQLLRQEKSAVGMLGKLLVRDDGTCTVDGYCKPTNGGIATKSDTGYRVLERIDENIIRILFTTISKL